MADVFPALLIKIESCDAIVEIRLLIVEAIGPGRK